MSMADCTLNEWTRLGSRGWVLYYIWTDGRRQRAGEVFGYYRDDGEEETKAATYVYAYYTKGGEMIDAGSSLSLSRAKKLTASACREELSSNADSPCPKARGVAEGEDGG